MSELRGFPMVNQLDRNETEDGRPSENYEFNCVPSAIVAGLQYLTKGDYHPDTLKDYAYGEGWANQGTAASAFIPYCALQGVTLRSVQSPTRSDAVKRAHQELAAGHPVVFTQQDDYSPSHPEWTHVSVFYKDSSGALTCMDPFGGKSLTYPDATWASRLRSNELWVMEVKAGGVFDRLGHVPLWTGNETARWSLSDFHNAAVTARGLGCTCLIIKIADGTNVWYGGLGGWQKALDAVQNANLHAVAYTYCYGDKFHALGDEIKILADAMRARGIVIADMESEFDGQNGWANTVCNVLKPVPGIFGVTTWANPNGHRWQGVLSALAPCSNFWMPQVYTDYLAGLYHQQYRPYKVPYFPILHMGEEYGANHQVATARAAGTPIISIWEYQPATSSHAGIVRQIAAIFGGPHPQPQEEEVYHNLSIQEQDAWFKQTTSGKDDTWTCKQNTHTVGGAILKYFRQNGGVAIHGLPETSEWQVDKDHHPEVVDQRFQRSVLRFDPHNIFDRPVTDSKQPEKRVYPVKLMDKEVFNSLAGPQISDLQKQIDALKKELAAGGGGVPTDQSQQITHLQEKLKQIAQLAQV
jgi:hypothetical protein